MAKIRAFLLGRQHKNGLRFEPFLAERPGPDANIPGGVAHKLSGNYYYTRDARREVAPPNVLTGPEAQKALEAGQEGAAVATTSASIPKTGKTPGGAFGYSTNL